MGLVTIGTVHKRVLCAVDNSTLDITITFPSCPREFKEIVSGYIQADQASWLKYMLWALVYFLICVYVDFRRGTTFSKYIEKVNLM